jgi:hypothetical protein
MMKAMAPKAPMGATRMIQDMILKISSRTVSMRLIDRQAAFAADDDDRGAEEHGEEQHLQQAVVGKGADHAGGDDIQDEGARVLGRGVAGLGVERVLGERAGSMFRPAPGWTMLPTARPKTRAKRVAP